MDNIMIELTKNSKDEFIKQLQNSGLAGEPLSQSIIILNTLVGVMMRHDCNSDDIDIVRDIAGLLFKIEKP